MGRTERRGETSGTRRHGTTRRRTAHRQARTQAVLTFRSTYAYHILSTCACLPAVALLPSCFPLCSYFVAPGNLRATLRGAEHRRAMHFLPFAVAGILGASSGLWNHSVLTWALCELVALLRDLFGPDCVGGGVKVERARDRTGRLTTWMHRDFQGLFGPLHSPKLHRLLAHVFDELRLRGSLLAGDTGINERKHKSVKLTYTRTNRRRADHALQLLMADQVTDVLRWTAGDEDAHGDDDISGNDESAAGDGAADAAPVLPAPSGGAATGAAVATEGDSRRLRRHGRSVRVGVLAAEQFVQGLAACLELSNNDILTVPVGTYLARGAALRRGGVRRQIVRASADYYGAPWLDWVAYIALDGVRRAGRARVVITGVGRRATRLLVVERAHQAAPVSGCPFTAYRCTRLRFEMRDTGVTPMLECVPVSCVRRVLCVEYDWVDWVARHGLEEIPTAVPTTREEVKEARFFINAFVDLCAAASVMCTLETARMERFLSPHPV